MGIQVNGIDLLRVHKVLSLIPSASNNSPFSQAFILKARRLSGYIKYMQESLVLLKDVIGHRICQERRRL